MAYESFGDYEVFSWSVAGNETCVGVRSEGLHVAFDMGFAPPPLIACNHVFISHGHADHIGALMQHMKKRRLNRLPKAVYYIPERLVEHIRTICKAFAAMSEQNEDNEYDCTIVPMTSGTRINASSFSRNFTITDKWSVEAIETDHTVKSLGYLVYRTYPNSGAYAEVAYLGDSRISVIKDAVSNCPDLLTVQLLIMEATFLDQPQKLLERAHAHGHTHLQEIRQYASLFKSVGNLYLIHFSARYNASYIEELVRTGLPGWLARRVVPSVRAQRILALDF
ncbi:Ribonuclease Z chloroplastic [Fasciolopsis buskii]|uniref:Ribonuclease Z chloroplastic n=1 Tax=Fasciolopsis buskii TaxID=27845 RepID=A0A8E0VHF7_9TREM|nr:Ribonuclease Z chloroplastic [Fasciolopsis buski]